MWDGGKRIDDMGEIGRSKGVDSRRGDIRFYALNSGVEVDVLVEV